MKNLLENKSEKVYKFFMQNKIKSIFYFTMITSILAYFFILFISKGRIGGVLFHPDPNDTFMDFFNVVYMNYGMDPIPKNIYPPFAALLMVPFYGIIPRDIAINGGFAIRDTQSGLISLIIFIIISLYLLFLAIDYCKKGSNFERKIFLLITLLSMPFLFQFERQNLIIFALIFLMGFVFLKDSENKCLRELSLIFLACSACIKFYPAIFGLLLLKEKRFKEAIRSIVYGVLIFVLPFFIFGGIGKISQLIENILTTNKNFYNLGYGLKVDMINLFRIGGSFLSLNDDMIINFASKFIYILLIVSIPAILFLKSEWKTVGLLTCIIVATPNFSFMYNLIYFIIPIIIFIDYKGKRKKSDYIFLVAFLCILIPVSTPILIEDGQYKLTYDVFIKNFAVVYMYIHLIINGYIDFIKSIRIK